MAVCIRAHVRYRKSEDFCEWMLWFHLIEVVIKAAGLFEAAGRLHAARAQVNLFCHARSLVKRCAAVNSPGQESGGWTFSGSLFRAVKLFQLSRPGSFTAFFPAATAP
jgi:hypothetical protein